MAEEELRRMPAKGWAEMIRKVYQEVLMASAAKNQILLTESAR
jgi:hypothetical protein